MTSGMTVVVGFAALLLTPLSETKSVGIAGLVVVAVAVLLSTTLLPALLAVLGRSIDRPRWIASRLAWYHRPAVWERWARSLSRHPYRAVALGGGAIAILTVPAFFLRIGLPSRNWWPTETEAGAGIATLERMGMSGYVQPLRLIIEFPDGHRGHQRHRTARTQAPVRFAARRSADPRRQVAGGSGAGQERAGVLAALQRPRHVRARSIPDFLDAYLARDGRTTLMDVIPADTTSLTTTMDVVRDVRHLIASRHIRQLQGATIRVGGYVAGALDFQQLLLGALPVDRRTDPRRDRTDAGGGVQVGAGADQGRGDELALGRGHVRHHRAGLPARHRRPDVRHRRPDVGDLCAGAGAGLRRGVRPVDGLRSVPADPDQGSVRHAPARTRWRRARASRQPRR